jgi:uncharacterized protein
MAHRLRPWILISALAAWCILYQALAAPAFPPLTGRIVDQANILNTEVRSRLDAKLAELETKSGTQLVVATLRSLDGYDIADYGYQLGRHWGIGQRGKNNGVLLIVAPSDRKVRIEVGYGLEGNLTDAVTRLIIDNSILPRFRAGDFAGGIERGSQDIIQVLSGDAEEYKKRAAERFGRPSQNEGISSFALILIVLFLWWLVFRRRGFNAGGRSGWLIPPVIGGGWSGGGWSSGSGSGGGGFSGGGGSFGGGGSSGSW